MHSCLGTLNTNNIAPWVHGADTINLDYSPDYSVVPNRYPEGCYCFKFIEYLTSVFSSHFSSKETALSSSTIFFGGVHDSRNKGQTELQKVAESLNEEYKKNGRKPEQLVTGKSAILWMQYLYISNKFNTIDIDE